MEYWEWGIVCNKQNTIGPVELEAQYYKVMKILFSNIFFNVALGRLNNTEVVQYNRARLT